MEWLVRLEGDEWSLEDLPRWFSQLDHKVRLDHGKYYLTSSAFDQCSTGDDVWQLAEQIVERINGASRAFSPFRPVRLGSELVEIHDNGTRKVGVRVCPDPAVLEVKGGTPTLVIDGKEPAPTPTRRERLVACWEAEGHESDLGRALRIDLLPAQTWWSLYHVYEVIKHGMSGGTNDWKAVLALLPAERDLEDQLNRFRDTANDPKHAGTGARHGRPLGKPVPNPMSFREAQLLIHRLLLAWLATKI